MIQNVAPITPALRDATPHARAGFFADGWLAPPIAIPILLSLFIIARAFWLL